MTTKLLYKDTSKNHKCQHCGVLTLGFISPYNRMGALRGRSPCPQKKNLTLKVFKVFKAFKGFRDAHKLILTTALGLTLAAGCAKNSKVVVASGYTKQVAINASVAVVILDEEPEIIYRGDALRSLREINLNRETNPNKLIWDHFQSRLLANLVREVDITHSAAAVPNHKYLISKEVVKTTDELVKVEIPDKKTRFVFDSTEASLVLFLDHIRLGTETDPYYAERAEHGLYTATARKLVHLASFVLWDNRELKHICYGRIKSETPIIREEATLADWEEVSRDLVRQMFSETGFLKPKIK